MKLSGIKTIKVEKGSEWEDERLDLSLSQYLNNVFDDLKLSRTVVSQFIPSGVYINGKTAKPSTRPKFNDELKIDLDALNGYMVEKEQNNTVEIAPVKGDLDVIDETKDWLVLNKKAGFAVHPSLGNANNTLANYVKSYLIAKGEYDETIDRAGVVHRLDKPVSGLILFAKTREFQEYILTQFESKRIVKRYIASVEELSGKSGSLWEVDEERLVEGFIRRDPGNRLRRLFNPASGGKFSASRVKYVGEGKFEVEILTGRTHQIRATLRYLGFAVKGDSLYGSQVEADDVSGIDLKCVFLQFTDQAGEVKAFKL